MDNKDITAIITNYNIPKNLLLRCVKSIEEQGIEYIIVDDCSTENKNYLVNFKNVHYLKKNSGTYKAFEYGLNLVKTKYTMRVDADDYIVGVPDTSSDMDGYINNIHGKITLNIDDFVKKPYAGLNGAVIKTDIFKKEWYSDLRYCADIIIFVKIVGKYNCVLNEKSLYRYVKRKKNSITAMKDRSMYVRYCKDIMMREYDKIKRLCKEI